MTIIQSVSRRHFVKLGLVASAGLLVGCSSQIDTLATVGDANQRDIFANSWLHLSPDGTITFFVPSSEMGQGVETALTQIIADELDADWNSIHTVFAPYNAAFDNPKLFFQVTGGSTAVNAYWMKLRELGAAARGMLVAAAAAKWDVPVDDCRTENAIVYYGQDKSISYGDLASTAAQLTPPSSPKLKDPKAFTYMGKSVPRRDTATKVNGTAQYGIDVVVPGMLYAAVAQSPVFGGEVVDYDEQAALNSKGVHAVVAIPHGMAVVADSYWRARKGLEALAIVFQHNTDNTQNSADYQRQLRDSVSAMETQAFPEAKQKLDLEYEVPFVAHQPMEPMNCTAHVTPSSCKLWVPTQNQHVSAVVAARITGLPRDKIEITTTYLGGGFGRRLKEDFVEQAVIIAKAVGKPVKMIWSREEDMQHDFYRATSCVRFQIALDDNGRPSHWYTKLAVPSHFQKSLDANVPELDWFPTVKLFGDSAARGGLQRSLFEPNPFPYDVGDLDIEHEIMSFNVPTGSLRSVQHSYSGFFKESAIDECAHAAGQDPLDYRRKLLTEDPRYHGVLNLVAEKAQWGQALEGHFQGLAVHRSFNTYVAEIVELSVTADKAITIHRITCAVDCGIVINPKIVQAQISGGALWGLDTAFFGEILIEDGRTVQSNFHDYPVLRMDVTPPVEVHIVESDAEPTGVGELGLPPLAAALANALFAATGERARALPFSKHGYTL